MNLQEAELTEQDSLDLTINLLRSAIFSISYNRGLFPDDYFIDEPVPALDMIKIKQLMPRDAVSRLLIEQMEKGVYNALQKKYLKTLKFCIWETDGPMIEEYAFSLSYPDSHSQDVMMEINLTGNKEHVGTFNSTADITPEQMRKSARKMVRDLLQWMFTLDNLPDKIMNIVTTFRGIL